MVQKTAPNTEANQPQKIVQRFETYIGCKGLKVEDGITKADLFLDKVKAQKGFVELEGDKKGVIQNDVRVDDILPWLTTDEMNELNSYFGGIANIFGGYLQREEDGELVRRDAVVVEPAE